MIAYRTLKVSRRRTFVIERAGEVNIELDGVHLASVCRLEMPGGSTVDPEVRLDLYKSVTGEYVAGWSGREQYPFANLAQSADKLLLELLDQNDSLGRLEKMLLEEGGKRDAEVRKISRLRLTSDAIKRLAESVRTASTIATAGALEDHLLRIEKSLDADPEQAIGSAKELLETVAKQILQFYGKTPEFSDDFPKLVKEALKELRLAPDSIPDSVRAADVVRQVLRGLTQVVHSMAELRNVYGTGHGKVKKFPAEPRHARLAVGAAATISSFALATLDARILSKGQVRKDESK